MRHGRTSTDEPPKDRADSNWRAFCAIEVPDEVGRRIKKHIEQLRREFPSVPASWSRQEKFHLTLKFFGNIQVSRVADLSQAAAEATLSFAPFSISIGDSGTFPRHGTPRVLWIGVRDSTGRLAQLHHDLEDRCSLNGFEREERPFHPHLTIARLRSPGEARELGQVHSQLGFTPVEMLVTELIVFRSEPGPQGSRYSAISKHELRTQAS